MTVRGEMLWFNEAKDIGFIATEDGERVSVHGDDFVNGARPQGRCAGLAVVFELSGTSDEPRAEEVRLESELAPRRARRRGSSFR